MEEKKKRKRIGLHSIQFKISCMVLICVVVAVGVTLLKIIPDVMSEMRKQVQDNMTNMSVSNGKLVEFEEEQGQLSYEEYKGIFGDVKLDGIESSYAYLVDSDGTMLYHPTKDKVGSSVENEVVTGLVQQLQQGIKPENACVTYEFKGVTKYAGYFITESNKILVVTADESEVMEPVNNVIRVGLSMLVFVIIIFVIIVAVFARMITKPIVRISDIVSDTSRLDFHRNPYSDKLCRRKDETGYMSNAVREMRQSLRNMVNRIEDASGQIETDVEQIDRSSNEIREMCTSNSAITEELAASMEETSATTENIAGHTSKVQNEADTIKELAEAGDKMSDEVMERAAQLQKNTEAAGVRTQEVYERIRIKTEAAMEKSKAVRKINELTDAIMSISSQTGLLALNASIEAARAGEAGRGFAVVASEIGNLANETSVTVTRINEIIEEVNNAVKSMTESLDDTIQFLEGTVLKDYADFREVGDRYMKDARGFQIDMNKIQDSAIVLTDRMHEISGGIDGISSMVSEAAIGIGDIAAKTTEVVSKTNDNYQLVENSRTKVEELRKIVEMFHLN